MHSQDSQGMGSPLVILGFPGWPLFPPPSQTCLVEHLYGEVYGILRGHTYVGALKVRSIKGKNAKLMFDRLVTASSHGTKKRLQHNNYLHLHKCFKLYFMVTQTMKNKLQPKRFTSSWPVRVENVEWAYIKPAGSATRWQSILTLSFTHE